jgi:hypothetical protein
VSKNEKCGIIVLYILPRLWLLLTILYVAQQNFEKYTIEAIFKLILSFGIIKYWLLHMCNKKFKIVSNLVMLPKMKIGAEAVGTKAIRDEDIRNFALFSEMPTNTPYSQNASFGQKTVYRKVPKIMLFWAHFIKKVPVSRQF